MRPINKNHIMLCSRPCFFLILLEFFMSINAVNVSARNDDDDDDDNMTRMAQLIRRILWCADKSLVFIFLYAFVEIMW